jgi:hypothetical protein
MPADLIAAAVMAAASRRNLKVALVIACAADALLRDGVIPEQETCSEATREAIAARRERLVADGRPIGYGDLRTWRHSETRRAIDAEGR